MRLSKELARIKTHCEATSTYTWVNMVKRIFATVKPEILKWARTSAGFTADGAAKSLKVQASILALWEEGTQAPSIPQLRSLAILYKRPLAVFYLQEEPLRFQVLSDLRRPRQGEEHVYSPLLTQAIRSAQQRRVLAQELAADIGEDVKHFPFRLEPSTPEEAGEVIRKFLGVTLEVIRQFRSDPDGRAALNSWRSAIEDTGVLVFQSSRIPQAEASGFALAYDETPVIVINRKDGPQRRLFSLLHEFAHVALRESGVSDLRIDRQLAAVSADVEMRCNAIAAAALMPIQTFKDELQSAIADCGDLTDEAIARVARRFGVSRLAVVLRLVRTDQASWAFYFEKNALYKAEHEHQLANREPPPEMKRNIPQESLSDLGRPFIGLVLGNYHQRNITLSDVAGYLGVRVKHVGPIERRMVAF